MRSRGRIPTVGCMGISTQPADAAGHETFSIDVATAQAYEDHFVPAIFATWAPILLDAARVDAGDRLLDVACGTGIVARTACDRVGPSGSVTGVDLNPAMLTVAARTGAAVTWRTGDADALPFDDEQFDVTVCQMAMMFFPDRRGALREMRRVTRRGGTVAVLVPASLDDQPAYGRFVEIAASQVGTEAQSLLSTYWSCGDRDELVEWHRASGLEVDTVETTSGPARFADAADFVRTEVGASPLAERIDATTLDRLCAIASVEMAEWATANGFEIPLRCHVVVSGRADSVR